MPSKTVVIQTAPVTQRELHIIQKADGSVWVQGSIQGADGRTYIGALTALTAITSITGAQKTTWGNHSVSIWDELRNNEFPDP